MRIMANCQKHVPDDTRSVSDECLRWELREDRDDLSLAAEPKNGSWPLEGSQIVMVRCDLNHVLSPAQRDRFRKMPRVPYLPSGSRKHAKLLHRRVCFAPRVIQRSQLQHDFARRQ